MGEMLDKQVDHTHRVARLIIYAESFLKWYGCRMKITYCLRCPDCKIGHSKSLHYDNLASDFVIFEGGEVLKGDKCELMHNVLHNHWDTLGGAKRIKDDLGHYSTAHRGMR